MKTCNHLFNKRLFPSTRGGGKGIKAESFIGLVQANDLLLQQLIQILVLQHHLLHNGLLQKYGDQKLVKNPCKRAIFPCKTHRFQVCYLVHVNSQVWSYKTYKNRAILSYFNKKKKEYKE